MWFFQIPVVVNLLLWLLKKTCIMIKSFEEFGNLVRDFTICCKYCGSTQLQSLEHNHLFTHGAPLSGGHSISGKCRTIPNFIV
jgi:hypothetical protein